MTAALSPRRRLRKIFRLLESAYGNRKWSRHSSATDQLIMTILSQNTSDQNSRRAFRSLKENFGSWGEVADARASSVARVIRSGGLSKIKAPRIIHTLRSIRKERGNCSLQFLRKLPHEEGRRYLESFQGVGPKTAACVLLFSFNMPVFPVDTHILRVTKRLGLIDAKVTADMAHKILQKTVPAELHYPFHLLLIEHGRRTCKARRPRCRACVLRNDCPSSYLGMQNE